MNKESFINKLNNGGDCYVNYISPVSRKQKYHVATVDFRRGTSPYINNLLKNSRNAKATLAENQVLVFCYDLNDFKPIDTSSVTSVVPLNNVIKQHGTY